MFKTEHQHPRHLIEQTRLVIIRLMLQCITDLDYTRSNSRAETQQARDVALYDCFHPRGFIAVACRAMGYDTRQWRRLAVEYLTGAIDHIGLNKRVWNVTERQEAA